MALPRRSCNPKLVEGFTTIQTGLHCAKAWQIEFRIFGDCNASAVQCPNTTGCA